MTAGQFWRGGGSSQQTCKIKAKQGDKFSTLILCSFPTLLDHLCRTRRRLRRQKLPRTLWGRGWLQRPFLSLAAAEPGEKPSGLTFRGSPPAVALVSTSCWSCFGQSPSLSSPCCGRKVQGVLAAGSSFAPPSALHTSSPSSSRVC